MTRDRNDLLKHESHPGLLFCSRNIELKSVTVGFLSSHPDVSAAKILTAGVKGQRAGSHRRRRDRCDLRRVQVSLSEHLQRQ